MWISIIGVILGVVVLVVGAYKGLAALPLTLAASAVVIASNGMDWWESYAYFYINGYLSFFRNFFLIFVTSALYAKIMEETGAAIAIGYKFVDWFGAKRAVLVVLLTTAVLTYGGVSLFVVIFAIAPIIMILFNEANIPRAFAMGPLLIGAATFTMKSLPGSPQATNIVPTTFLGTDMNAGAWMGIVASVFMFVFGVIYLNWEEKRLRRKGEHFEFIPGTDVSKYKVDRSELPSAFISFLPMIVVVGIIIIWGILIRQNEWETASATTVVVSMLIASILAILLNWEKVKSYQGGGLKGMINTGTGGALTAIAAPAAIVAFGGVVQNSPAFHTIVDYLLGLQMHPYVMASLAPSVIAGITGSSSGGLLIAMQSLSDYFIESGADLGTIHRLSSMFAGTFDTLPHSTALFLMFGYLGITHKEGYRYVWWGTTIIPTIVGLMMLAVAMVMG